MSRNTPFRSSTSMEILTLYSIAFASFFGLAFLFRIAQLLQEYSQRFIFAWFRKHLMYSLISQRSKGSIDINILTAIVVVCYIAGNIFCLSFRTMSKLDLANRASFLFGVNLIPIYLGARSNLVLDRLVKLRLAEIILVHHWMGRMALVHAAVHAITRATMGAHVGILQALVSTCLGFPFSC
jgi:hypothetical protein